MATYYKDKNSPLEVELPLEQFLTNKDEVETFKQLTSISIENQVNGCTCPCNVFMTFINHKEINCKKSKVL